MMDIYSFFTGAAISAISLYIGYRLGFRRQHLRGSDDDFYVPINKMKGGTVFAEPTVPEEAFKDASDIGDFIKKTQPQDE